VYKVKVEKPVNSRILEAGAGTKLTIVLVAVLVLAAIVGAFTTAVPFKIGIGVLVGIIVFVLTYRNLQFGLVLFLILNMTLPQAGPGINLGIKTPQIAGGERGIHFNLHEIVMAMVLIAWLAQVIMKKAEWRTKSPLTLPVLIYIAATILSCFVGLIHGANVAVPIFRFIRTAFFAYIFFVVLNTLRTRKQFQQLVLVILICSSLVALFGMLQFFLGQSWAEMVNAKYLIKLFGYPSEVSVVAGAGATQVYRINGTFLHPNIYGGYLAFVLPFFISVMGMMFRRKRWGLLSLLLIGFAMNAFCLVMTGSRASWIAFGLIMLLYGAFGLFDRRLIVTAVTVAMILVLLVVLFKPPDFIKQRFVSQSAKEATSGRMMQYKLALDFFMDHPIFGLGMGMEGQKLVENGIRKTWAAVENVYLTYLVSEGLLGLATFLLVLVFYWVLLLWARKNSEDDDFVHFYSEALILGMVGFAVSNLFGAWLLFAVPMITLFWFFIAMGASMYNIFGEETPSGA